MTASRIAFDPKTQAGEAAIPAARWQPGSALLDILLGTCPKQRKILSDMLLSVLVFMMALCVTLIGMRQNMFIAQPLMGLALCWAICVGVFYGLVRSGLNRSFADITLVLPQSSVSQTLTMIAYGYLGAAHAGALLLVALIALLGMLHMRESAIRYSCAYIILLLGVTLGYHATQDPLHYPPNVELIYFIFTVTVVMVTAQTSMKLCRMRQRLKTQKLELRKAYEQMCALSTRDELTGLVNRRQLRTLMEQHVERQQRVGQPFYVAMLDLDHFKLINDTHGHHIGDIVLKNLANAGVELLRKTDTIGRWGGEEFLLLLPDTGQDLITTGLIRLQNLVAGTPMSVDPRVHITFSAGLTRYRHGESIDQTVMRADYFLYQAKTSGRNRIVEDPLDN